MIDEKKLITALENRLKLWDKHWEDDKAASNFEDMRIDTAVANEISVIIHFIKSQSIVGDRRPL